MVAHILHTKTVFLVDFLKLDVKPLGAEYSLLLAEKTVFLWILNLQSLVTLLDVSLEVWIQFDDSTLLGLMLNHLDGLFSHELIPTKFTEVVDTKTHKDATGYVGTHSYVTVFEEAMNDIDTLFPFNVICCCM
jgi:hypothetical protein